MSKISLPFRPIDRIEYYHGKSDTSRYQPDPITLAERAALMRLEAKINLLLNLGPTNDSERRNVKQAKLEAAERSMLRRIFQQALEAIE